MRQVKEIPLSMLDIDKTSLYHSLGLRWKKNTPCQRMVHAFMAHTPTVNIKGRGPCFRRTDLEEIRIWGIGGSLEDSTQMVNTAANEAREAKETLQQLSNQVRAISDVIEPELAKQITTIRNQRIALVSELRQSLDMLKDVRKFFLESDYDKEMERMERFVRVCQQIKELKDDGTFDAVCDSAIRLAVREERP
jgi:hypothetical protein